jgi:hypothetical protein
MKKSKLSLILLRAKKWWTDGPAVLEVALGATIVLLWAVLRVGVR